MKNLDCNQIKIFINLEIIGEEKLYIFLKFKNFKKIMASFKFLKDLSIKIVI